MCGLGALSPPGGAPRGGAGAAGGMGGPGGGPLGLGPAARGLREAAWRGGPGAAGAARGVLGALGPGGAAAALAEGCAESGWTALHVALFFGRLALARELLAWGARPDAPDACGRTPLDLLAAEIKPLLQGDRARLRGELVAWGSGANFQLGTGGVGVQEAPARIEALRGCAVKAVAAGKFHSCALDRDGRLWTWGHGRGGRLGHPDFDVHSGQVAVIFPRWVRGLPGDRRVLAVAAGKHHTAAICEGGAVWTWGNNRNGQLGYAGVDTQPTPRNVRDVRGVAVGISAANFHTVSVTQSGEVFTWGGNGHAQLGYGTSDASGSARPRVVEALRGRHVVKASASKRHTACVTREGDVLVWGHRAVMPRRVHLPELGRARGVHFHRGHSDVHRPVAVDVAAGAAHTTVLTLGGLPMVWRSADPLLRAVPVALPGGVRGVRVSAGKERTAVMTECGNLYVWEGKPNALEAALKRDAGGGGGWAGPPQPELVGRVRHAAELVVGEKHSLCLQQTYQPQMPPETPGGGVPSLHSLAQRALAEHVADAHNALALAEIAGDLEAHHLQLFCQRLALGNLDLLIASDAGCLGAVSSESIEDLERMARGSRVVASTTGIVPLEEKGVPDGGAGAGGGFFDRATAPNSASAPGLPWSDPRPGSPRGSLREGAPMERSFSDAGRSVWEREEAERLGRNLRKKLQQIEALEELARNRGSRSLDDQQQAKLARKEEILSALFLLDEGSQPVSHVAAMVGAAMSRRDPAPPQQPILAAPAGASPSRLAETAATLSSKKKGGKRKAKKASLSAVKEGTGASSSSSPPPPTLKAGETWADISVSPPLNPGRIEGARVHDSFRAAQDFIPCAGCSPPAGPSTPSRLSDAEAAAEGKALASYNYCIAPIASEDSYPRLGASPERPPAAPQASTHGFSAAGGSGGATRPASRKTPSKGRKGGLSLFLQGGLDAPAVEAPSARAGGSRMSWGKNPAAVPPSSGEGLSLREIQEQQEKRPGLCPGLGGERGVRRDGSLFAVRTPPAQGRQVLGDFLGGTSRASLGSSPPAWGSAGSASGKSSKPQSFQDVQAEALELRNRKLQSYGGSPGACSSPLLASSPSGWYCPEADLLITKGLREIQSEEAQASAAEQAATAEAGEGPAEGVAKATDQNGPGRGRKAGGAGKPPPQRRKRREASAKRPELAMQRIGAQKGSKKGDLEGGGGTAGATERGGGSLRKGGRAGAPQKLSKNRKGAGKRTPPQRVFHPESPGGQPVRAAGEFEKDAGSSASDMRARARRDEARAAAARALEALS